MGIDSSQIVFISSMAPFAKLMSPSYSSSFIFRRDRDNISPSPICCYTFSRSLTGNRQTSFSASKFQRCDERSGLNKCASNLEFQSDQQVCGIHCIQDYEKGLRVSEEKLVIAHFSASCNNNQAHHNRKVHQFVDVNYRGASLVKFLHVMVDESDKTREICMRENIEKIPCFVFYRNRRKVHVEAGFQPEKLINSIRYHSDDHHSTSVVQLHAREDFDQLIENVDGNKLIVLNVAMRQCVPCVKIYPSVVALANQMTGKAIFARINADECESCMQMCRDMEVAKVPTFLFFKNGDLCGRYVGSCSSYLIREIDKF